MHKFCKENTKFIDVRPDVHPNTDMLYMPTMPGVFADVVAVPEEPAQTTELDGKIYRVGKWVPRPLTEKELKINGFVFEGKQCSATKADQDAVLAAYIGIKDGFFAYTNIEFANGTKLRVDATNLPAFGAAWAAFRNQFFS